MKKYKEGLVVGPSLATLIPSKTERIFSCGPFGKVSKWSYLEGWCVLLSRKAYLEVGGFDEQFNPYLSEDADLCFLLKRKGYKLKQVFNLPVIHYGSKTLNLENSQRVKATSADHNKILYEKWFPKKINSILLKRRGARGDVLLTTPIIKQLKKENPKAKITYLTECPEMLEGNFHVDAIVDRIPEDTGAFDKVYDLKYERAGHSNYIDEMAKCAEVNIKDRKLEFNIPKEKVVKAKRLLKDLKGLKIAFHIGKTWKSREWEVEKFLAVGKYLVKHGHSILECGDKNTPFLGLGKDCRKLTISETAAVLAQADIVVGIDSLVIHIAAAVNTPVIVIYGCTLPEIVWSEGRHYPVSVKDLPCAGCRHKQGGVFTDCKTKDYRCLKEITVSMVVLKIEQAIKELP